MGRCNSKYISQKDITLLCDKLRRAKKKIVFTNGVFDIIHMGHVAYLTKARTFGDVLIIGLNTDKSVRRIKGKNRPINKQSDRIGVLLALECVDYVVCFSEETPEKLIKRIKPDVLVKGADYKIKDIVGSEFVKSYGGQVKRVRLLPGRSTSSLIRKMRN